MNIIAMSDLHLSQKPWQVRKALKMAQDAELVLIAGDLVNDGTPTQMESVHQCIAELLPNTVVLAVAGNHDYPRQPSPIIREGLCDYPALQDWLLNRQPNPKTLDDSGAWAVCIGDVEVIGLNCVSHWRRFKFDNGDQLKWLKAQLDASDAVWRIILCHAPLLAHNPKRIDTKPYLSRDAQLQAIIDSHEKIVFISGHTHVSMSTPGGCVEYDKGRNHIYINDGSIRPTTMLREDGKPESEPADGNIVKLLLDGEQITITAISMNTGEPIPGTQYCFFK